MYSWLVNICHGFMAREWVIRFSLAFSFCVLFILLKKPKGLLIFSKFVETTEFEKFATELKVVVRGTKNLIDSVTNDILPASIISIGCSAKEGGFGFCDEGVEGWVQASKKIPSVDILPFQF